MQQPPESPGPWWGMGDEESREGAAVVTNSEPHGGGEADLLPVGALTAAQGARYGEETDIYTWDRVAEAVLRAAAPLIRADERKRITRDAAVAGD